MHPVLGYSWEGYAIEQICQLLPSRVMPYFYRTADGAEMDLVLARGQKVLACIEIKTTDAPSISKGMMQSIEDLNCKLKKVADTEYRILAELIKKLGGDIPETGLPTSQVYLKFIEVLEKSKEKLLILI